MKCYRKVLYCQSGSISSGSALFATIKQSPWPEEHINLEILTDDPWICTVNHLRLMHPKYGHFPSVSINPHLTGGKGMYTILCTHSGSI